MDTTRSMARNAAAMAASQLITWMSTFLLVIYLPRALGAADYGKLQFGLALMAMFATLVDFGTGTLIIRDVARDRNRAEAYLVNVLLLKLATGVLAYAALVTAAALTHRPPEVVRVVHILGLGMLLMSGTTFLNCFLQGFEQVHHAAWGSVIDKVVRTAVVLALLLRGDRLIPIAWAMAFANAGQFVWAGYWVLREIRPRIEMISLGFMRQLIVASFPFLLYAVFAKIYDKIDISMLAVMTNDSVVGCYGAAYRLFESLFFLPFLFASVTFPVLSRLSAGEQKRYLDAVHRSFGFLAAAAVGVSATTLVLAGPLVSRLYPQAQFPGTAPALRVLALALGCMYLNTLFVMVLQTTDRQTAWTKAGAVAALVNPAVNYFLIPRFGHLGAAWTTVITEAMLMGLALRACPRGVFGIRDARTLARALLAGVLLAGALRIGLRWGLLPALLLGGAAYLPAILFLRVMPPEEIARIGHALLGRFRQPK